MPSSYITRSTGILLPLAIVAGGWFLWPQSHAPELMAGDQRALQSTISQSANSVKSKEPHRVPTNSTTLALSSDSSNQLPETQRFDITSTNVPAHEYSIDEAKEIANRLSDNEFTALEKRIQSDPILVGELLQQYRVNTDLSQAKQLAALLAASSDFRIVETAASLLYSGESESMQRGLELLSRIQPHSHAARDIAIELLSSETNPDLLVSTMNVLATPAKDATGEQRISLLENLLLLAEHPDARVRSHSLTLLGRWDNSQNKGPVLVQGLTDTDPIVRARSASALRHVKNPLHDSIYALLSVAENPDEVKTTRQSALYSLSHMALPDETLYRYQQAVITVRRTRQ
ncbi:hypothetical protein AB833_23810 [Chromatiales bacterium (ex Bugula neritina AB1)]|nr:hypothetical protein AB833_23810 [Chromatiales bacterium (ex Bugula neritina AB1)]